MNITIENNEFIYIQFINKSEFGVVDETLDSAKCFLLYDGLNNWLGIQILNENDEGKIDLPHIHTIDFPMHNLELKQTKDSIEIIFNKEISVIKMAEQECNIDIYDGQIFGIELILWAGNKLGNKEIVGPFISREI